MRRLTARLATLFATGMVASTLGALSLAAPANAAPPVVVNDTVTMYENTIALPVLLANDTDPDGDELKVCRIEEVLDGKVMFAELFSMHLVIADVKSAGTYTFKYWACDFETLVPGTLTVVVKPSPKMTLSVTKIKNRPGKLKVVNKNGYAIDFAWGHAEKGSPDKQVRIGKKKTKVISVRRKAVTWVASNGNNGAQKYGYVKGIKLPKKQKPLPPSPRPRAQASLIAHLKGESAAYTGWLAPARPLRER
ncbi:Ig-like domain-containing protein [Nocardioides jishulii]|uniref:Uncharacterized protein n=1 Tax=Nocardioides jishulii TaxID=2575440 RepID=A0A4U2YQV4_9ACTN|nr:Ig-like domain-containing protein [Nocardioides jishulii]QCX26379.1 hypothetical protein FCL41_01590 [Nocardioides jishulii]TKI63816.1 hypothetical protein FC770_01115 [Nocardioides jishulii]